jgi:ribosomal protein S18 acetylase RimI-like enzyme
MNRVKSLLESTIKKKRVAAPSGIVIRPLQAEDLERLFEPIERASGAQWLARQERGELYVAVAEIDGVPVGRRCLDFTCWPGARIAHVFAASVRSEWQSRGIGSLVDDHLGQVALARGFDAIRCVTAKSNSGSVRWHERLGYRRIGEGLVQWTEADGREVEVDCWKYERPLGSFCGYLTRRLLMRLRLRPRMKPPGLETPIAS